MPDRGFSFSVVDGTIRLPLIWVKALPPSIYFLSHRLYSGESSTGILDLDISFSKSPQ